MTIRLREISKSLGEHLIVNRISLEVNEGEFFVLLGSSGSGKSTILRLIAGLLTPDSGVIELNGKEVTFLPPQKREVGFVFQNYALFRHMTVRANVEFGLKVRKTKLEERRQRCDELLELIGLAGLGERMPEQLSGGQRQRVALARALAYKPQVLLLDEPFGALDVKIRVQLRRSLREIQRQLRITTILVTHDQEEAFELADRIGVVERGALVEIGTPQRLYHQPANEYVATFLGGVHVVVGRCEKGGIRLGDARLPYPPDAPQHEEGAPVRILFRPETVRHQTQPFNDPSLITIGQGRVVERIFAGAAEKVRFELETLRGTRPLMPALSYGQRYALIEASDRSASDFSAQNPVAIDERRWIALSRYHVLTQSGIKLLVCVGHEEGIQPAIVFGKTVLEASHGSASMLRVGIKGGTREAAREHVENIAKHFPKSGGLRFEVKARPGILNREIVKEIQEGDYDLVVLNRGGPARSSYRKLNFITRRILIYGALPVVITGAPVLALNRILVCTAAGEPGKSAVHLAGRLARHTGGSVTILHVLRSDTSERERSRVERHLAQAAALLDGLNVKNEICLAEEAPREAILKRAGKGNYDLIVIGAPGRESAREKTNLAAEVVQGTNTAVAIVPMMEG